MCSIHPCSASCGIMWPSNLGCSTFCKRILPLTRIREYEESTGPIWSLFISVSQPVYYSKGPILATKNQNPCYQMLLLCSKTCQNYICSVPDHAGEAYSAPPDSLAGFKEQGRGRRKVEMKWRWGSDAENSAPSFSYSRKALETTIISGLTNSVLTT